jgi:hypothetical protein
VLNGSISAKQALQNLQTTWTQLPADSRGSTYK